jgi:arylsulfatase A-like enzyme/Flp pilus assembly protein TadD
MVHRSPIFRHVMAAALAAGLGPLANAVPAKAAPTKSNPHPSVILITIDTLRADHVGCYGAEAVKTPTLDGLARDGVVFERAISQVPLTWPSHAVILTGTYPFQNGVQDFTGQPLAPQFRSVAQSFKQAGYATGAVVSAFVLDRSWGLGRGFDFYDDAFSAETFQKKDIGLVDRRAEESIDHAIAWLKKTPRRPFFLWLHLYDPHSPYDPPEPYRSEYRSHPYDGEIAYADHELGRLMAWLKQNKLYDSSVIVALSDHGESLGEHGEDEHGFFVYNATVHVPLIVKPPAGSGIQAQRRRDPVETAAVAPSLLQLAGVKDSIQTQFQTPSMFAAAGARDAAYSETFYPFSSFGWSPLRALETGRYHYIEAPQPELYDMVADPEEKTNRAGEQTATVAVLEGKLQQRLKVNPFAAKTSAVTDAKLNPDAAEKLRALGYMAYHSPVGDAVVGSGQADPKEKLWEFNAILKATDAFQIGDDEKAKALLAAVREKDPDIYIVAFLLGETALRRQNWEEAATELKKCLELNPNFDQAMTGLARALDKLGNPSEARQWLDRALKFNSQNYRVWYELGHLESRTDKPAAVRAYEKAITIQPNFAPVRRDLGMLQFQQQNYSEAAEHLGKAADLGLDEAPLFNFLGISYSRTDRLQKAVATYQRALKLDPDYAEAHLNLGFAYQRLGRAEQAGKEYDQACRLDDKLCRFVPGHGR